MKNQSFLAASCAVLALALPARAAVLGIYDMGIDNVGQTSPAAAFSPTSVAAGLTFGDINIAGSAITAGGFFTSQTTAGGQPSRILSTQTAGTTPALAMANNSYFQFTVTPDVNETIEFASISVDTARGGGSARGFSVTSSADNFTAIFPSLAGHPATYNAVTGIATQEDIYTNYAFDLSSVGASSSAVTFRFYVWSGAVANTIYFDNITVDGALQAVPEPSAFAALAGLGVLGLAATRRRRSAR